MVVEDVNSKEELRKYALNKRKNILEKQEKDEIIKNKLSNTTYIKNSQDILIYVSKEFEVDTLEIIEDLLKLGKNIYVPRIDNKIMIFYKLNSLKELKFGYFNILEPTSNIKYLEKVGINRCIIVPGLMFDKFNNRLGYGGGYYDKFLSNNNIFKIGICYSDFYVEKINVLSHDIKMNLVITDTER